MFREFVCAVIFFENFDCNFYIDTVLYWRFEREMCDEIFVNIWYEDSHLYYRE